MLNKFRSDESGCPDQPLCGEDNLNLRVYPIEQTIEEGIVTLSPNFYVVELIKT